MNADRSRQFALPSRTLADFDFRSNGIGFLRILFAATVLWSHSWGLGSFGIDPTLRFSHGIFLTGYLAVGGFFVLSGFLIARSGQMTSGPTRFLWHRVLRIYPAFWVCLIMTAFAIAPLMYAVQVGSLNGFMSAADGPLSYVYANASLVMFQPKIANLMASFPFSDAMNGSLWTLAWEFNCYICVGVFGAFTIYRFPKLALAIVAASIALTAYFERGVASALLIGVIPALGLFVLFFLGVSAYLFRDRIPMHWSLALAAAALTIAALPTPLCRELTPIPLAYLVLFAAMHAPLRNFDRRIDCSYGLYLYATPVMKLQTLFGFERLGMPIYCACATIGGLTFAAASWWSIEKPALRLKNRWVRAEPRRAFGSAS